MMPLMFASPGDEVIIKKVGGSAETKKHLEDLGFVVGGTLTVAPRARGPRESAWSPENGGPSKAFTRLSNM